MYCRNCGAVNPDGAEFCSTCGAALAPETPEAKTNALKKLNLSKNKLIAIIAAAAAVIVLIVILAVAVKPPAQAAVSRYINTALNLNYKKVYDVKYPKFYFDYLEERCDENDTDFDEIIEKREDNFEDYSDNFYDKTYIKLKKAVKAIKFKILRDKKLSNKEIKKLNKIFEERYDTSDKIVTDAREVKIEISLKWKDPKYKNTETCTVYAVKVKGKWYAFDDIRQFIDSSGSTFSGCISDLINGLYRKAS